MVDSRMASRSWLRSGLAALAALFVLAPTASARQRAKDGGEPAKHITILDDIAYRSGPSDAWRLDLAMPQDFGPEIRPAIVIIHGGGWSAGTKRDRPYRSMLLDFALKGYVTVSVEYRLTGEAPFPAGLEDVDCAVRWVRAHAREYRIDPDRIGAFGHSAGAHLAVMLASSPPAPPIHDQECEWSGFSDRLTSVVGGSTPTVFPARLGDSARYSPASWVSDRMPPILLIHGTDDNIVPVAQVDAYVEKLKAAGAPDVTYVRIDGGNHGVAYEHFLDRSMAAITQFFARTLKFPQATISNGQVSAKMYLPDANDGYYRSTRFDWSGAVYSLRYEGHEFYGPWFDSVDPKVINWVYRDGKIVSGPCSALEGPVDEFQTPLGWDDAKPGGTFIKIGVGVLRKTGDKYDRYFPYPVVDAGKWTVKKHDDAIEFTQVLSDPELGYGYVYRKIVRLVAGKPEMVIERSLKNTGRLEIKSEVYDHNFTVLDHQPPGPDFTIEFPYQIQTPRPPDKELVGVRANRIVYAKQLSGEDQAIVFMQGFGDSPEDSRIVIENGKVGAGMTISGDRPLIREFLWSIRTVLAIEAYVAIDVEPGNEFTWSNTYDYYTVPTGRKVALSWR